MSFLLVGALAIGKIMIGALELDAGRVSARRGVAVMRRLITGQDIRRDKRLEPFFGAALPVDDQQFLDQNDEAAEHQAYVTVVNADPPSLKRMRLLRL